MITQSDLARSLGVSQTTVSFALRGHPAISAETSRKVKTAAEALGYRPDPMISALMAQRRRGHKPRLRAKLAFIAPFPNRELWGDHGYIAGCFEGAREASAARGYLLEFVWLWGPSIKTERLNQILLAQNVQGLLIAPMPVDVPPPPLAWDRFAAVSLDFSLAKPELHRAVDDHAGGMVQVMKEIARLGYRRPGLVLRASQDIRTHHTRLGTFLAFQSREENWAGLSPLILPEDRWDAPMFAKWLELHRPDVVLTEEAELLPCLRKLGRNVPRDVGVVYFHMEQPNRQLTGLRIDSTRVGAIAAGVLTRLVETNDRGAPSTPTTTLVNAFVWQTGRTLRPANIGTETNILRRRSAATRRSSPPP